MLIARVSDVHDATSVVVFVVSLIAFVVTCEHLLPVLIVRLDPEQVLDFMLPVFHPIARVLQPTTTMIRFIGPRRDRENTNRGNGQESETEAPAAEADSAADDEISEEEGRELLQSIVNFTETVARGDDTRPDIVAVQVDTSIADLRALFREERYSRMPVYRDSLDNILGIVYVKDMVALPPEAAPPLTT